MKFYSLSLQFYLGLACIIALLTTVFLGPLYIATNYSPETISAELIKENSGAFGRYLKRLKSENGVLILGTSETSNQLGGQNYWGFLQSDSTSKIRYDVLGGAGRTASKYFPLILQNSSALEGLKVCYYVNPTYWRQSLNTYNPTYTKRYLSESLIAYSMPELIQLDLLQFVNPGNTLKLDVMTGLSHISSSLINYPIDFYFHDLKDQRINRNKKGDFLSYTTEQKRELKAGIDSIVNTTPKFWSVEKNRQFPKVDSSSYRYVELRGFIKLCKQKNVELSLFLGPYNQIMCKQNNPEYIPDYEEVLDRIRAIANEENTPLIDASYLSYEWGTLIDAQHTSRYGGWVSAKLIKEHYE